MNETSKLRESIRGRVDLFMASEFEYKSTACILNKMVRDSEIYIIGTTKGAHNRPVSVYKVGTLKTEKVIPKQGVRRDKIIKPKDTPLYVQLWSKVYPDLFAIPDFSGYKQSVRKFIGC